MPILLPMNPFNLAPHHNEKDHRELAVTHCREHFSGRTYTNRHSGDPIIVTMRGVKHTTHKAMSARVRALAVLPQILESAEKVCEIADKAGRPDIKAAHKYEVVILDGSLELIGLIVVREAVCGSRNFYDFSYLNR